MKTRRFTMKAALVAAVLLTGGCKKETNETTAADSPSVAEAAKPTVTAEGMLRFATAAELSDYLDDTEGNNRRNGFVSFGKMADDAYYSIVPEEMFSDMDEVIQFVLDNRDLYQLILGSDGEYTVETRYYDHPYRDVANVDGLFQVGDTVYRIIEGGLVYTSQNNFEAIRKYEDKNCRESIGGLNYYEFNSGRGTYICSEDDLYNEKTVGNNRITLKITNYDEGPFNNDKRLYGYTYLAKPYHLSLGWWGCNRTITGSASVGLSKVGPNMNYVHVGHENQKKKGNRLKFSRVHSTLLEPIWYVTFSECTANTPDVGTVRVYCY